MPESATAAVITVTAVRPADAGYLTVHPCSVDRSPTSTVNYAAGLVSANSTIATLDGHGRICVYTHAESDVLVDITGWLGPTGETRLDPIGPTRAADTRIGHGGSHRLAAGDVMTLDLGSHLRFGTRAVALNVTAVRPDDVGYLTVYPCASSRPATSTLNYVAGDIRPNNVIVGVTGRQVCIYTHAATDVLVDLVGSFGATGLGYHPVNPQRVLDTRLTDMALLPDSTVLYGVATSEVTPDRPAAASVNITAVGHSATGHVTTYDCATRRTTSTLNQLVGQVAANGAIVPLTDRAASCAWSSSGGHLIVDMNGWWVP